jgi:hypothetical protein
MKNRRREERRSGADRRGADRRANQYHGRFLIGLGGPDLDVERRQELRRHVYRRSLFNRRAAA